MDNNFDEKLLLAQKLTNSYKFKEALRTLEQIDTIDELQEKDQINFNIIKSSILFECGEFQEAIDSADFLINNCAFDGIVVLNAHYVKGKALYSLGRFEEYCVIIKICENLFSRLNSHSSFIRENQKANLSELKARYYWGISDLKKSLIYFEKMLKICKKNNFNRNIANALNLIAWIYFERGEFNISITHFKKALKIFKKIGDDIGLLNIFDNIGWLYRKQGNLDKGLKYMEQGLNIAEKIGHNKIIADFSCNIALICYEKGDLNKSLLLLEKSILLKKKIGNLIHISVDLLALLKIHLDQDLFELASENLEDLKKLSEKNTENHRIKHRFLLAKALFLKKSKRYRSVIRAENILNDLMEEEFIENDLLITILLNLCEIHYQELQFTKELEILEEIPPLITKLLNIAENEHSYLLLAEIHLFNAKIALIDLRIEDAQMYLSKAQNIARQYNLVRLEKIISMDHDKLLKKLDMWEKLKKNNAPLKKRFELISVDIDFNRMLRKEALEDTSIQLETPILLTIISKGGTSLFTHYFAEEWKKNLR